MVGVGYVGLPLSCAFADAGFKVFAIDVLADRIEKLNRGICPIQGKEPGLPELLSRVVESGKLEGTTDISNVSKADAIFVCVDTPIGSDKKPNLDALIKAVADVAVHIRKGALISIESTLPPGTIEGILIPTIGSISGYEPGAQFSVVHCPERVMPGKLIHNLTTIDRVLGGLDETSLDKGASYYSAIMKGEIHRTDLLSAEITKTLENTYRDVQIAFANEVALACEELGANAFEIRKLVNTCPFRDMHVPGAGVGGHCLPKDSWLFASGMKNTHLQLILAARNVNESMPSHMVQLVTEAIEEAGRDLSSSRVTILGLAFLRDSDDVRNSPALQIIDELAERAELMVHDPFVERPYMVPLTKSFETAISGSDCAVIVTDHTCYTGLNLGEIKRLMRTPSIVDGRNVLDIADCATAGISYRGIGKGKKCSINGEKVHSI